MWERGRGSCCAGNKNEIERGRARGGRWGARGTRQGPGWVRSRARPSRGPSRKPLHARPLIGIKSRIENRNETDARSDTTSDKYICFDMMQHPYQLRFLFTRDMDVGHYTALKIGRRSGTGREKRVTPEFGRRR
jgi:hypothetical protein